MDLFERIEAFQKLIGLRKQGQISDLVDYTQKELGPSAGSVNDVRERIKSLFDAATNTISRSTQPSQLLSNLAAEIQSYFGSLQNASEKQSAKKAIFEQLKSLKGDQYFTAKPELLSKLLKDLEMPNQPSAKSTSEQTKPSSEEFSLIKAYREIRRASNYLSQFANMANQSTDKMERQNFLQLLNKNVILPLTALREQAKNTSGVGNLISDIDKVFSSIEETLHPDTYAELKQISNSPLV